MSKCIYLITCYFICAYFFIHFITYSNLDQITHTNNSVECHLNVYIAGERMCRCCVQCYITVNCACVKILS